MRTIVPVLVLATLCAAAPIATPAQAQATRTWVASVPSGGDDINPCSRTLPCRTFSGAISKTATGGIISCVDADGFSPVTITKAITIDCTGVGAGILGPTMGTAVVVNAANAVVILRGLTIVAAANAQYGVRLFNAAALLIENTSISGFGLGIDVPLVAGATARLVLTNSSVNGNTGGGLNIVPAGNAKILLDNARLDGNAGGIFAMAQNGGTTRMTIKNSSLSANSNYGIAADGTAGVVQVMIDNSVLSDNGSFGITTSGASATVFVCCSTMAGNDTGWASSNGAGLASYGNNNVNMNISGNGMPSFPAMQQ